MNRTVIFLIFIFVFSNTALTGRVLAEAVPTPTSTLRQLIEEKASALQQIQVQRQAVEKNLEEINKSNDSLKKEINYYDANISQLNLSIKANRLNSERLSLEIDSTNDEISKLEENIQHKKDSILKLFTALQIKDRENLLTVFLKGDSLSDSVSEVQTIERLNNVMTQSIGDLRDFQNSLSDKLEEAQSTKQQKATEKINLVNRQQIVLDQKSEKQKVLEVTKNQEKIYEQQLSSIEKLQASISDEIEQIESVLRQNIDPNLLPMPRHFVLLNPVPEGRLTQKYGRTPYAAKAYKSQYHNGFDFGAPVGTPVLSAEDGTVINVGDQDRYCRRAAYGKFIEVKHTNGLSTLYGHLSKQIVTIGQQVKRGDTIGYVGRTGWATGPHLHFTIFASQTLTPARPGFPEGSKPSNGCGPMPVGGDINPDNYL
jgi:murein DD-endopeptidase MepM/ murein hydrolase activator NlpD